MFLTIAAIAASQTTLPVSFEASGDHQVWITFGLPLAPPAPGGTHTKLASYDLPTDGHKENEAIFVWDLISGNLASKMLRDAKGGWMLKESDYMDIAVVKVRVENGGKPVASASIDLNDTRRTFSDIVSPSSSGEVAFFAVKPGTQKVTIKYKGGEPITQEFKLGLKRSDPNPVITIAIPGKVDTVAPTASKPATGAAAPTDASAPKTSDAAPSTDSTAPQSDKEKSKPAKQEGGSFLGTLIGALLGIGVVVGIGWFAIQYYKKNEDTVNAKLTQMGVQVPTPGDDPGPIGNAVIPTAPVAPTPPQKIVLDDAAPTPIAAAVPMAAMNTGVPRLLMDSGDAVEIPDGQSVVGRDLGLWLSLAAESTVSRNHAVVIRSGSSVVVRDTGSTNGTYLNGQKISSDVTLTPGDSVQFGAVRFRYEA